MLPTYDQYVGNIVMLCWQHIRIKSGLNFSNQAINDFKISLKVDMCLFFCFIVKNMDAYSNCNCK